MLYSFLLAAFLCGATLTAANPSQQRPEQVHIAYGDSPSEITVTWNTPRRAALPRAQFGVDRKKLCSTARATSRLFVDGGSEKRAQWIYRAKLTSLLPGQRYYYRVGSSTKGPWSKIFSFVTMRTDHNWGPRLLVFGDLGLANPKAVPWILNETRTGKYDAILHVGDIAYDMASNNARQGDAFMRLMEPIAANIPYMTCPGNHEYSYNFSNYRARFSMPGSSESIFYSFDMGPVHFVSISTEIYFYIYFGISQIKWQFRWLENDLKTANLPQNRAKRPWIILYSHRPMYCSNGDLHCRLLTYIVRNGFPLLNWYGLEDLLQRYGVDLTLWGHEHSYERMWPVLFGYVRNGTTPGLPYVNPSAPVHIVSGSAGCVEKLDHFKDNRSFSAFRASDYGYSRLHIVNRTHINFEQVSTDRNGEVIDSMTLVRTSHGVFKT